MSNDLLKQLEEKITAAIETIELSRMELTELKEQNNELENRYVDWEDRLSALIEKFEQLENEDIVEIEAGSETPIQKEEEENIEELGAEENEADPRTTSGSNSYQSINPKPFAIHSLSLSLSLFHPLHYSLLLSHTNKQNAATNKLKRHKLGQASLVADYPASGCPLCRLFQWSIKTKVIKEI